jgi:hypothetical protein
LALERVRARTMAMQKSDELPEAANLLFQQVQSLGMPAWSAGYCTWDNDKKSSISLSMSSEGVLQPTLSMPLTEDPSLMHFREAWERGESFFVEEVGGDELKRHYTYLRTLPGVKETLDEIEAAGFPVPTFQIFHLAYFSKGFLLFITYEPVPEAHDLFKRFAKVFEQTYTRFLDLQKVEAQGREAQIELGLERVRARTMAMHRSEELAEAAAVLFNQFVELGNEPDRFSIGIINEETNTTDVWATDQSGSEINVKFRCDNYANSTMTRMTNGWKAKESSTVIDLHGEELKSWLNYVRHVLNMPVSDEQVYGRRIHHLSFFSHGWLNFTTHEPLSADVKSLLDRFASVFNLTFRRFLDLQKAETQARDAQIETALKKFVPVRWQCIKVMNYRKW